MYLLSAGTAPSTMLYGTMPWNLHAPLVQGPLSLDIGPPEWHSKAAQMSLISTSTAPFSMLCRKSTSCFRRLALASQRGPTTSSTRSNLEVRSGDAALVAARIAHDLLQL